MNFFFKVKKENNNFKLVLNKSGIGLDTNIINDYNNKIYNLSTNTNKDII